MARDSGAEDLQVIPEFENEWDLREWLTDQLSRANDFMIEQEKALSRLREIFFLETQWGAPPTEDEPDTIPERQGAD